ncbi:MAG: type IV secretion system DNA-binding domain-containing protein [Roseiarcus sp.]
MSLVTHADSDVAYTPFRSRKRALATAALVLILMLPTCLILLFIVNPVRVDGQVQDLHDLWQHSAYGAIDAKANLRLGLSLIIALIGAGAAYMHAWAKTPLTEPFRQRNDTQPHLYYGEDARIDLIRRMNAHKGARAKKGLYLAPYLPMPFSLEIANCLVVGSQGSGKSSLIRAFADQAIERGDRVLLLCVKGDVTASFTAADSILIAAHDAEGLALDLAADVETLADAIQLAHDCIPPSNPPFWSDTARIVLTDLIREVMTRKPEVWNARDIVEATMASAEVLRLRILAYDLSASPFLQSVETDGEDKTVTGVLLTLRSGVYTNLRPLAWAWDGFDKARRFSIKRWLAEDYKGIRTVIVQYSAEYAALSTLVVGRLIRGVARRLSDPQLRNDRNRRVVLALDEIHMLKIDDLGSALARGREKGLVCWAGTQNCQTASKIDPRSASKIDPPDVVH